MRFVSRVCLAAMLVLPAGAFTADQAALQDRLLVNANADRDNWRLHGRTYDNQRFSPLTQIDARTISRLKQVRTLHTGVANSFEATPLVIDGILYLVTATNHVQAWDAVTGRRIWEWKPEKLDYTEACCGPQARGVAVAYGMVYTALFDGHLVALDAKTGHPVWQTDPAKTHPEPKHYYTYTLAPQVYDGMVIVGTAGAEYETRGMVEAYDAMTGARKWEFRTTAAPGEPGGDTWGGDSWRLGGGSVWNTPAIDVKNGLVIFATGNPNPDYRGETRPGDNAYTDSIVAIDAATGKLKWWYQEVPHDLWDYDASAPVMLFDAKGPDGRIVPAAGQAGKVGNVFIVNRLTGRLLYKSQPFVTQSANMFTPPRFDGVTILPGVSGGSLWQPPAFSPRTHYFYVLGANVPMTFTAIEFRDSRPGGPWVGRHTGGVMKRADGPQSGTLTAIDVDSGRIAWQYRSERPMYGGVLATASGLVFAGEMNGDFSAFDAATGKKLWSTNLGTGVCSPPITYQVKGVQYVAVGANGCRGGHVPQGRPEFSDGVAIFALQGGARDGKPD
jgi:PQQ-dependent dehydrogenase (methanol/ethanol family)